MAKLEETLREILEKINSSPDLSEENVIDRIKDELEKRYLDAFHDWEKNNFYVDYKFTSIRNLLFIAAENGCERVAKFLIKKGADVNIQINSSKEPPLHYAIRKGHAQVVKVLLEGKANVNLKDRQGYTSLHIASQFGRTQIVEDLLKDKINIDVQNKYGKTPLYYAVKYEHIKIVKLLLEKGADPAYAHKPKAKKVGIAVGVITAIVTPLILAHTTVLSTLAIIGATIASALIIGSIAYGVTYMASKHALSSKLSEVNCDEVKKPLQV